MKRDLPALARVFIDHVRTPGLTTEDVIRALAAVFAADRDRVALDLRTRRIENIAGPAFARAERELGLSREEITSPRYLVPGGGLVMAWLLDAGLSVTAVAELTGRARGHVRSAAANARRKVIAETRRAAHG
ncbi:MAG: hypothetical protein EPN98_21805 [Phenylobacterium sp.]|uniref:hypothetical protein n=1 Tax=Phenylobacterium sp. TaxID=1871053 RepID=UPI0011F7FC07|nr:hypothetical protein [Phenylobacterium sp.]TAL29078.1 MAG: hypothetical protein EPN98_21805 [Phenylobacterium sp.]